jgi:archaellum component FlaF (FlaF/FlaG flagellin family)
MGLSVSAAALIVFAAFLYAMVSIYGAMSDHLTSIERAIDNRYELMLERSATKIEIVNVTYNQTTAILNITTVNIGNTILDTYRTDVLVNGIVRTENITALMIEGEISPVRWLPEKGLNILLEDISNPERVMIVTENGISDCTTNIYVVY